MGIDLGALLRGAATGISSFEEGKRARQEMERQARLQLLQESVQRANIERLMAQAQQARRPTAPPRPVTVWGDQGLMQYDQETGAFAPARTAEGGAITKPRLPPGWIAVQNEQGEYEFIQKPPGELPSPPQESPATAGRPVDVAQGPATGPGAPARVLTGVTGKKPEPKPPTGPERQSASYAARAAVAAADMTRIEQTNLAAAQEAARALNAPGFARLIPFIGIRSEQAARALREVGLSDEAQQYMNNLFEFAQNAAPGQFSPGAVRSPQLLYQIWTEYGVQPGERGAGAQIKARNRLNFVRQGKLKAGKSAWEDALQEYGLDETTIFGTKTSQKTAEELESKYGLQAKP